jgi:glycosyltransferase involved in cell wall biosynthesis
MTTYNHEKYIKEAVESVLNQNTTFDFEIILSNDCSTDNTSSIIHEIIKNHPRSAKLKFYDQIKNLGMHENGEFVLRKAEGKYIAICEGDDYWTDECKLEEQVKYFETNPNCGLVHHDVNYYFQHNNKLVQNYKKSKGIKISNGKIISELILNNYISTLSVLFKKDLLKYYFEIDKEVRFKYLMTDYFMWLLFSTKSEVFYLNKTMATYRVLNNSASNTNDYNKKIEFLNSYCEIKYFFLKQTNLSNKIINNYKFQQSTIISIRNLKFDEAIFFAKKLYLNSIKNVVLFLLSYMFFYLKTTRFLIKYI